MLCDTPQTSEAVSTKEIKKESYHKVELNRQQIKTLLRLYKLSPRYITQREFAKLFGLPINRVTPRFNELLKKGLIERGKDMTDTETNRKVSTYRVVHDRIHEWINKTYE